MTFQFYECVALAFPKQDGGLLEVSLDTLNAVPDHLDVWSPDPKMLPFSWVGGFTCLHDLHYILIIIIILITNYILNQILRVKQMFELDEGSTIIFSSAEVEISTDH